MSTLPSALISNKVSFKIYAFFSDAFWWREKNTVSKVKKNERVFASRREDDTDTIFTRKYNNNNNKWYQK